VMLARNLSMHRWSEQTIATLVMQTRENSMTCYTKPGLFGRRLTSRQGEGEPNPTWIPIGHDVVRRVARRIVAFLPRMERRLQHPMTAHLLGGAVIGDALRPGSSILTTGSTATLVFTSWTVPRCPPT